MSKIYEDSGLFWPLVTEDAKLNARQLSAVPYQPLHPADPWLQAKEEASGGLEAF